MRNKKRNCFIHISRSYVEMDSGTRERKKDAEVRRFYAPFTSFMMGIIGLVSKGSEIFQNFREHDF